MIVAKIYRLSINSLTVAAFLIFLFAPIMSFGETMDNKKVSTSYQKDLDKISKEQWDALGNKDVYFGHQSVGSNIMEGVHSILEHNPSININIINYKKDLKINGPYFVDNNNLGQNNNPELKINAFIEDVSSNKYDIAFMKFCFDDIYSTTDINGLFEKYKQGIELVKNKNPNLKIVHFTVPLLKKSEPSIKSWIKGLLGKSGGYFDNSHNVARNKFNRLLIDEYGGKEPLFDLAKYESTYPDGHRESFTADGKIYYSLVPEYTNDSAHLNEKGRYFVAVKLLTYLAKLN